MRSESLPERTCPRRYSVEDRLLLLDGAPHSFSAWRWERPRCRWFPSPSSPQSLSGSFPTCYAPVYRCISTAACSPDSRKSETSSCECSVCRLISAPLLLLPLALHFFGSLFIAELLNGRAALSTFLSFPICALHLLLATTHSFKIVHSFRLVAPHSQDYVEVTNRKFEENLAKSGNRLFLVLSRAWALRCRPPKR